MDDKIKTKIRQIRYDCQHLPGYSLADFPHQVKYTLERICDVLSDIEEELNKTPIERAAERYKENE